MNAELDAIEPNERLFLEELGRRGVRYLVIGMASAILQGARGATEDIDLWFERTDDPRIAEAARAAGGLFVSGSFGMAPPQLGGGLGDRFVVVVRVTGADAFSVEFDRAREVHLGELRLRLMPLDRILASKRAAGRAKDLAQIPALEEALVALDEAKVLGS